MHAQLAELVNTCVNKPGTNYRTYGRGGQCGGGQQGGDCDHEVWVFLSGALHIGVRKGISTRDHSHKTKVPKYVNKSTTAKANILFPVKRNIFRLLSMAIIF